MTLRTYIRTFTFAATLLLTAATARTTAKESVDIGTGYRIDSSGMHFFLPSGFMENTRNIRILIAKTRMLKEEYDAAVARKDYSRALTCCDSLIRDIQKHTIRGANFAQVYQARALMLHALQREAEACQAYAKTLQIQDSIMRCQQNDAIRDLQTVCELDRLALDKALLQKQHHHLALISVLLLFFAILAIVAVIFRGNRRTKRLQGELLRKIDLARASEEQKTAFINSMCHEVRTPLNSLTGFSELFCAGEIPQEMYAQYHEIIRTSRQQLRYMLDDMLEVAYLENLEGPLPKEYTDLCALCRTQIRAMRVKHPRSEVAYTSEIPNCELGMSSNGKYLAILLGELLENAHKFTTEGNILLKCGPVGPDKVSIVVTDTGCGIPPEEQKRVFERFVKLDTFSQGNGLGLYLCSMIVRHLGGEIHIDPEYTAGVRIIATLPRK